MKTLTRHGYWQGLLLLFIVLALQAQEIPTIKRRVTDLTGTLNENQLQSIESSLAQFEQETSTQIAVLVTGSLEGEPLEDYSMQVAEKNGFGKKGKDNGVFLFIAKNDKKLRIEVGYGLEGALPDAICDQIIRHVIVPEFKRGDFYSGIGKGVEAIMLATKGEFKGEEKSSGKGKSIGGILFALIAIAVLFSMFGGRRGGGGFTVGPGGFRRNPGLWLGGMGSGFGGGFSGGGGGFSGGGFSGGGGSFGGGGASGSW